MNVAGAFEESITFEAARLQGIEEGGDVMLRFAGCQLGVNLSKRVFEGNSRIASLAFNKNDRDTWWSSRRKTA